MALPKLIPAGICAAILGAQLWATFPIAKDSPSWYWPFLPYPMYAGAHGPGDHFFVPQLSVAECGAQRFETVLTARDIGVSPEQFSVPLVQIALAPHAPRADRAAAKLSGAIEAAYPGRYCAAESSIRMVSVSDSSTHHAYAKTRIAAEWTLRHAAAK